MLLVGLFNIAIDPYGVFNSPQFTGFNQAKPAKLNNMRLFKAVDVTRIKPVAVFLGSSRTEYGLDPTYPSLDNYQPAYNLAVGAATPHELFRYLQHAIANQPNLEIVIINLDEFMFNELNREDAGFSEKRLGKHHLILQDAVNTTLSLDAVAASQENISYSQKNREYQSYSPKGMLNLRPIDRDVSATEYRFKKSIDFYFQVFPEYQLSQKYLNDFQKIIDLCNQYGIEVKVFISPSHATRWETVRAAGHWQMFEQMKREIVKITPVWDFSGYNSITTEPISNTMKNYIDDSHYHKQIGNLVIDRLLGVRNDKIPDDFGILLTPENVESHLGKIRGDREAWAKQNLEEVQFVQEIKRERMNRSSKHQKGNDE